MYPTRVCAVVPLYNEEQTAYATLSELINLNCFEFIIALDDGSTDHTWDIISRMDKVTAVRHLKNKGKAESVYDGVNCCDADVYVFIDGDLGHSAGNIKPVIDMVLNDDCDLCIADMPQKSGTGGVGFLRWFSKYMVKRYTGLDFPCPMSGQRAVKSHVLKDDSIGWYHGFGLEVGMLIDCINAGYSIKYIKSDLRHNATEKDIKGYIHRLRQFKDILKVFLNRRW